MGYPGDQGRPGGWPPSQQPPHTPYGPGAEAAPYGHDNDEAPFAPRDEGPGTAPFEPFGAGTSGDDRFGAGSYGNDPFGNDSPNKDTYGDDPYGKDPFGGPADQTAAWADGPGDGVPPAPSGGPAPIERRRNMPLVIGGAIVAGLLLIGGGVALSSVLTDDSGSGEAKRPQASASEQPSAAPSPTQPVLAPVKLQSRTTDPTPLTLKEVFGKGKFTSGKHKYVRTAASATKKCTAVVGGAKLDKAIKKGGCTQALRATYALSSGSLIGTVGVFNLENEAAARLAVKAAADKDAFLVALPGKGVSKNNGKGEALGTSEARGHYLVMTWVQRPDGKKIAKKYHAAVRVFGAQLVKGSNLGLALHYRETEGEPLPK
jgi:hypothetical protein